MGIPSPRPIVEHRVFYFAAAAAEEGGRPSCTMRGQGMRLLVELIAGAIGASIVAVFMYPCDWPNSAPSPATCCL